MSTKLCPCGSEKELTVCCLPLLQGKAQPKTAEDLLRSRYTAFATGDVDYALKTHHSRTAHEVKREEIQEWSQSSEWLGLKIVQKEAGEATDETGTILFCANYRTKADGETHDHWEQSYFEKEGGQWKFLDAKGVKAGPITREGPKVGRNDPCTCGSGLKFKKCHGK